MLRVGATPEADLIAFVRQCLDLLGAGGFDEACAALDRPTSYGHRWTPHELQSLLVETLRPESSLSRQHPDGLRFTPASGAVGDPHPAFGVFADGSGFWVDHDVPINGAFSELTAQFEFYGRGVSLEVALQDLHVL